MLAQSYAVSVVCLVHVNALGGKVYEAPSHPRIPYSHPYSRHFIITVYLFSPQGRADDFPVGQHSIRTAPRGANHARPGAQIWLGGEGELIKRVFLLTAWN